MPTEIDVRLFHALSTADYVLAEELIAEGANDYIQESGEQVGYSSAWLAWHNKQYAIFGCLLERGARDTKPQEGIHANYSLLHLVIMDSRNNHADINVDKCEAFANLLIARGLPTQIYADCSVVASAIYKDLPLLARRLLESLPSLQDEVDVRGHSCTWSAADRMLNAQQLQLDYECTQYASLITELIKRGTKDYVSSARSTWGVSTVAMLLQLGLFELALELLQKDADAKDSVSATTNVSTLWLALHNLKIAIEQKTENNANLCRYIARVLIENGAKDTTPLVDQITMGVSTLWLALYAREEYIATQLISANKSGGLSAAEDNMPFVGNFRGMSTLWLAIDRGYWDIAFKLFISPKFTAANLSASYYGTTVLWKALESNHEKGFALARAMALSIQALDYTNTACKIQNHPLEGACEAWLAIYTKQYEVAKVLFSKKLTDTCAVNGEFAGLSLLSLVLLGEFSTYAKQLIAAGAKNTVVRAGRYRGVSPLLIALQSEYSDVQEAIMQDPGTVDICHEGTSLVNEALIHNRLQIAMDLILRGGVTNCVISKGRHAGHSTLSLLIKSCLSAEAANLVKNENVVDSLIEGLVDKGRSCLFIAMQHEQFAIAQILLHRGARDIVVKSDDEYNGMSVMCLALLHKRSEIIALLIPSTIDCIPTKGAMRGISVIASLIFEGYYDYARQIMARGIASENKSIIQILLSFPDLIVEQIIHCTIDDREDPIFNPLARYICPISQKLMLDPVSADDGRFYDRTSLQTYINSSRYNFMETFPSPITNEDMRTKLPHMNRDAGEQVEQLIRDIGATLLDRQQQTANAGQLFKRARPA